MLFLVFVAIVFLVVSKSIVPFARASILIAFSVAPLVALKIDVQFFLDSSSSTFPVVLESSVQFSVGLIFVFFVVPLLVALASIGHV